MPCISADGTLTGSGEKLLSAVKEKALTAEEASKKSGLPLFRVKSGLRQFIEANLVTQEGESYKATEKGMNLKT